MWGGGDVNCSPQHPFFLLPAVEIFVLRVVFFVVRLRVRPIFFFSPSRRRQALDPSRFLPFRRPVHDAAFFLSLCSPCRVAAPRALVPAACERICVSVFLSLRGGCVLSVRPPRDEIIGRVWCLTGKWRLRRAGTAVCSTGFW